MVRWIGLAQMIPKMYDTCIEVHGIGNNIFNPIYESEDKITQNLDRCIGFVLKILKRYDTCI